MQQSEKYSNCPGSVEKYSGETKLSSMNDDSDSSSSPPPKKILIDSNTPGKSNSEHGPSNSNGYASNNSLYSKNKTPEKNSKMKIEKVSPSHASAGSSTGPGSSGLLHSSSASASHSPQYHNHSSPPSSSTSHSSPYHRSHQKNGVKDGSSQLSPSKCKLHNKDKFLPREDLVRQIMEMGICRNGAVKALYWTGNKSALTASNWIFDQPERDLDTPLEDELEMIRAQQAEREREDREKEEIIRMCRKIHHNHMHHQHTHIHPEDSLDEEDIEELHDEDELEEEDDEDEEEDEEEEEDEIDMEYKMVFVVNRALELTPGQMTMNVSKATAGLFRKINSQAQSVTVGPDELSMWGDFGERTVILWADGEQHIKDLELMGRSLQLPCYMVEWRDSTPNKTPPTTAATGNGGVDWSGEGSNRLPIAGKAVLGIFGDDREVNRVTGRLKVVA